MGYLYHLEYGYNRCMKKDVIALLSLTAILLTGCKVRSSKSSSNNQEPLDGDTRYQISESTYNECINPHNVLLRSNYTMIGKRDGEEYLRSEIDYGKMRSTFNSSYTNLFKIQSTGVDYKITSFYDVEYDSMGEIVSYSLEEYNYTQERTYDFFFYSMYFVFEIPFDAYYYDSGKKSYVTNGYDTGSYYIKAGRVQFKNDLPDNAFFDLGDNGSYTFSFINHAKTRVKLPSGY